MNSLTDPYDESTISALEATLSSDRLNLYIRAAEGDKDYALRLYLWNLQLSESLYGPLQTLEVTMRNSMNRELVANFGPEWYEPGNPPSFQDNQYERIEKVKRSFSGSREIVSSDIVANISLGFWTDILYHRVYDQLWNTCLHRAFPHRAKGTRRSTIAPMVDEIKTLRNRIAHHEPIWRRPLEDDYRRIITIIRWSCPVTADWADSHSRFSEVFGRRPERKPE